MNPQSNPLRSNPEAKKILSDQAQIQALLRSPDARKILQQLQTKHAGQLQNTAQEALHGNTAALNQLLTDLSRDPNMAQAIQQLSQTLPK